jgi:hypothetical protein
MIVKKTSSSNGLTINENYETKFPNGGLFFMINYAKNIEKRYSAVV